MESYLLRLHLQFFVRMRTITGGADECGIFILYDMGNKDIPARVGGSWDFHRPMPLIEQIQGTLSRFSYFRIDPMNFHDVTPNRGCSNG